MDTIQKRLLAKACASNTHGASDHKPFRSGIPCLHDTRHFRRTNAPMIAGHCESSVYRSASASAASLRCSANFSATPEAGTITSSPGSTSPRSRALSSSSLNTTSSPGEHGAIAPIRYDFSTAPVSKSARSTGPPDPYTVGHSPSSPVIYTLIPSDSQYAATNFASFNRSPPCGAQ